MDVQVTRPNVRTRRAHITFAYITLYRSPVASQTKRNSSYLSLADAVERLQKYFSILFQCDAVVELLE